MNVIRVCSPRKENILISYNEAVSKIGEQFENFPLKIEEVDLMNAGGRMLAEDILADVNLPPFDNSAVDGIAVKYSEGILFWKIIGEISAGNYSDFEFDEHCAVRIMTGAKIPEFCDTIIPVEDISGDIEVGLKEGSFLKEGMNIRKCGSDIKLGEKAIEKNTALKARHIAAAASCGMSKIPVYKKLDIAVLATGDELIAVDEIPRDDKIRVSNNYSLISAIKEINQNPIDLGFVNDDRELIKSKIENILNSGIDILITTGGVSVGKYDYLKEIFSELDIQEIFWRAYIKPGKPAYFGVLKKGSRKTLVFGLPGNPVSCLVNFAIYIKPFISKLYGLPGNEIIEAVLENDLRKKDTKRHFMKAFVYADEVGNNKVVSQISQSSGNLVELSKANCLIEIEEERLNPRTGEKVRCIRI